MLDAYVLGTPGDWRMIATTANGQPAAVVYHRDADGALTLMYQQAALRLAVRRFPIPRPGEPDAPTTQQEAVLRRAAARRGPP